MAQHALDLIIIALLRLHEGRHQLLLRRLLAPLDLLVVLAAMAPIVIGDLRANACPLIQQPWASSRVTVTSMPGGMSLGASCSLYGRTWPAEPVSRRPAWSPMVQHFSPTPLLLCRRITFWEERPLPRPFFGSSSSTSSSELSSEYSSRRATFLRLGACCAAGAGLAAGSGGYART